MRSIASYLALFCVLSVQGETPKLASQQMLENVKQFALMHLGRQENLDCRQMAESAGSPKTIVVELAGTPAANRGTATSVNPASMIQDVFAVSSGTSFGFDHWGTVEGQRRAVYRYGYQVNGKTHSGFIFADENTGAISRITFRGADAPAHLFCSVESR
jgi:hypothetical protein